MKTTNLPLIVYFESKGIKPINVYSHYGKVVFEYDKDNDVEKAEGVFWDGKALIEPSYFFNKMREIKARIVSVKNKTTYQ